MAMPFRRKIGEEQADRRCQRLVELGEGDFDFHFQAALAVGVAGEAAHGGGL